MRGSLVGDARGDDDGSTRLGREPEVLRHRDARDPGDAVAGGDDGQLVAQRARDLAVGEQVLERLRARPCRAGGCGRPRATCARRAPRRARSRRASPAPAPSGSTGPAAKLGAHLPAPNRQLPGTRRARPARARRRRAEREADRPLLADRAQPAAEVDLAALGRAARGARSPPPARGRAGRRGRRRARRARAGRGAAAPGSARRAPRRGIARSRRRRRASASSSSDEALEQLRLLGQLGARLGDVPLRGGVELAQHRKDLVADPVAREAAGRGWSGRRRTEAPPRRPARATPRAVRSPAAGGSRARAAAEARAGRGARARPRAGRAGSRRDRSACGRSRPSRRRVARAAPRRPRSARRAPRPGGCRRRARGARRAGRCEAPRTAGGTSARRRRR